MRPEIPLAQRPIQARPHRLCVATRGAWRGYFILAPDALFTPNDCWTPFTLLFDSRSWTEIHPVPVKQFRGFTYNVPAVPVAAQSNLPAPSRRPAFSSQ
jgi:hypothetical protein